MNVNNIPSTGTCAGCYKPASQHCRVCKAVNYCSRECQFKAWKTHQYICYDSSLIPGAKEVVCKFLDGEVFRDITQEEFQKKTGSTYASAPHFTNKAKAYAKTLSANAVTVASAASQPIALHYLGDRLGYGLMATRDIEEGEIVCSLATKVSTEEEWKSIDHTPRSKLYAHCKSDLVFDCERYTSLWSFINDGPPSIRIVDRKKDELIERVVVAVKKSRSADPHSYGLRN